MPAGKNLITDGPALWSSALFFSLALHLYALSWVPLYPDFSLSKDRGGALGIPGFAEDISRRTTLASWRLNDEDGSTWPRRQ